MNAGMVRQVALLRGINNAGKGPRVAMSELRTVFAELGFRNVRTLLNSGNVVFSAPAKQRESAAVRIKEALASTLELNVPLTVLSADEITTAVRENPFGRLVTHPSQMLVVVPLVPARLEQVKPLLKQRWLPEALALGQRVAYLWCARGVAKSPLWSAVDRALGHSGTARNFATMTKLMAAVTARD